MKNPLIIGSVAIIMEFIATTFLAWDNCYNIFFKVLNSKLASTLNSPLVKLVCTLFK